MDYFKKSETQNREFLAGIEKQRQKFVEDMEKRQKDDGKKDKEFKSSSSSWLKYFPIAVRKTGVLCSNVLYYILLRGVCG